MWARIACAVTALGIGAAAQDDADLHERVRAALEKSRARTVLHLKRTKGEALALVCLAAAHDGLGADDKAFANALKRLARTKSTNTYFAALRLMVAAECDSLPDRLRVASLDLGVLLERQQASLGGFSYHPRDGWWDLSNTQYAALGLRAAHALGLDVPDEAWWALLDAVRAAQKENGGFTYRPSEGKNQVYASMTVAGIAVLEVCLQHLELGATTVDAVRSGIDRAWAWMDAHSRDVGDRSLQHCLYFHYGLERAGILSERTKVGSEDWYAKGAEMILAMQRGNGEFRSTRDVQTYGAQVPHAFAVLFLRRKFRRVLDGPTTPEPTRSCALLTAQATDAQVEAAIAADVARGDDAVPDLLKAMRAEAEVRRRAAAMALFKISGQDFRYHPGRTPEQNAEALRRAEAWWLGRRKGS